MRFWKTRTQEEPQAQALAPQPVVESEPISELDRIFDTLNQQWETFCELQDRRQEAVDLFKDALLQYQGSHVKITGLVPVYDGKYGNDPRDVVGVLSNVRPNHLPHITLKGTSDGLSAVTGGEHWYACTEDTRFYTVASLKPEDLKEMDGLVSYLQKIVDLSKAQPERVNIKGLEEEASELVAGLVGKYVVLENVHDHNAGMLGQTVVGRLLAEGCDPKHRVDEFSKTTHSQYAVATWEGKNVFCSRTPETRIRRVIRLVPVERLRDRLTNGFESRLRL